MVTSLLFLRVIDGARTRGLRIHSPALYGNASNSATTTMHYYLPQVLQYHDLFSLSGENFFLRVNLRFPA